MVQHRSVLFKMDSAQCQRLVFFIEWAPECVNFIRGITLSPSLRGCIIVHIFYRQDISEKFLPKYKPWLFRHPSSSSKPEDSTWDLLESYVTKFKFEADYSLVNDRGRNGAGDVHAPGGYYVVARSKRRGEELAEKMDKKLCVKIELVNISPERTLLDFVQFKCCFCRVAFKEKRELTRHDQTTHDMICPNIECRHNKKENGFAEENELKQHIKKQLRCAFCPTKVFCSTDKLEVHMKNTHKKCGSCPCGEYFGERLGYLDHFFNVYPSPAAISSSKSLKLPGSASSKGRASLRKESSGERVVCKSRSDVASSSTSPALNNHTPDTSDSCNHAACATDTENNRE